MNKQAPPPAKKGNRTNYTKIEGTIASICCIIPSHRPTLLPIEKEFLAGEGTSDRFQNTKQRTHFYFTAPQIGKPNVYMAGGKEEEQR